MKHSLQIEVEAEGEEMSEPEPADPATRGDDMTKVILAAVPLLLCLATAPVLADQVLYCVDTDVAGFHMGQERRSVVEEVHYQSLYCKDGASH